MAEEADPPDPHAFRPADAAAWAGAVVGTGGPPAAFLLTQILLLPPNAAPPAAWGFVCLGTLAVLGVAPAAGWVGWTAAERLRVRWGRDWPPVLTAAAGGWVAGTLAVLLPAAGCGGLLATLG